MKITVKIDNQTYEVEVGDLRDRPIVAVVDGEAFEVWPAEWRGTPAVARRSNSPAPTEAKPAPTLVTAPANSDDRTVHAPIPGVIISVAVQAGDNVARGQELCVLEAMKMKNVIRATRAGTLAQVLVREGQHVRHHDVLMEYADE